MRNPNLFLHRTFLPTVICSLLVSAITVSVAASIEEDYKESVLMIRNTVVVDNPLRTGLNPITEIKVDGNDFVRVTTALPHGRKTGDSVVLDGVRGLEINGVENWNFLIDEVTEKAFRLRSFAKNANGLPDGAVGLPVTATKGSLYESSDEDFLLGVWTFGHLVGNMVGEQDDPSDFLAHWSSQWKKKQTINGHGTDIRKSPVDQSWWPKKADGKPSLAKAPFRLLSIASRVDLWKGELSREGVLNAGEGRFVFCLTSEWEENRNNEYLVNKAISRSFTLIFEYGQKAKDLQTFASWVHDWNDLSGIWGNTTNPPNQNYLEHLEAICHCFSKRGADPEKPNGNSINQVRTNDFVLGRPWQLREFVLVSKNTAHNSHLGKTAISAEPALISDDEVGLWMTTTKGNPVFSKFKESSLLSDWLNRREGVLLENQPWSIPAWMVGGTADEPRSSSTFSVPGVRINEVRKNFSVLTCTGCHTGDTKTGFTMVKPRSHGRQSTLANFLKIGPFNDLAVRRKIMGELLEHTREFLPTRPRPIPNPDGTSFVLINMPHLNLSVATEIFSSQSSSQAESTENSPKVITPRPNRVH
jgi:hypothetical protein